jgi:hypothetical protein
MTDSNSPSPVILTGMPRSGTSWLGQLLESHPEVSYRMSPLFTWEFKNRLSLESTREEWTSLIDEVARSSNPYLLQTERRLTGQYPIFPLRATTPTCIVMKFDRHQHLIRRSVELLPAMKVIGIVRHPCGAIYSWLKAPREFPVDADQLEHWREGQIKKRWDGDHYGFTDWVSTTRELVALALEQPDRVAWVRYEALVADPRAEMARILSGIGLSMHSQVETFIAQSQALHVAGDYSVFKSPKVAYAWKGGLDRRIQEAIFAALAGTDLASFLDD